MASMCPEVRGGAALTSSAIKLPIYLTPSLLG
jgi:hypothetical protein